MDKDAGSLISVWMLAHKSSKERELEYETGSSVWIVSALLHAFAVLAIQEGLR